MVSTRPRVSIGMPVRNGQRFIREALDSLLAQTFGDFELIICDNASTDNTERICHEYAERDVRIRYFRHPHDIGPAPNYNSTFERARGEYFRWHAHDDLCRPEYLQRCLEVLDREPAVVLAHTKSLIVNEEGKPLEDYEFKLTADSTDPVSRFGGLIFVNHRHHRAVEIFGLVRAEQLRQTTLQGSYARADSVLLTRLALAGKFFECPERLFLSRSHTSQSIQSQPERAARSWLSGLLGTGPLPPPEWWDRSRTGRINFPEWNLLKEYWRSVKMTPLSSAEQSRCHLLMLQWIARNCHKLARDVIFAVEHAAGASGAPKTQAQPRQANLSRVVTDGAEVGHYSG